MKRTLLFLIVVVLIGGYSTLIAQDKLFTLDDYMNRDLYPESISNLHWMADADAFTYVENNAIVRKGAEKSWEADTILRLADFNTAMIAASLDEIQRFPGTNWIDENSFYFTKAYMRKGLQYIRTLLAYIHFYC